MIFTEKYVDDLIAALVDAAAHLTAAASAYEKHASRHKSQGKAVPDPFFSTRIQDFTKAADRSRKAIKKFKNV